MAEAASNKAGQPRVGFIGLGIVVLAAVLVTAMTVSFAGSLERSKAGKPIGSDQVDDGILAEATVVNVDPLKTEMTVRLAMQPVGAYDEGGLLSRPITLYYDSIDGTKQIDFKAGKPLGATDLAVPGQRVLPFEAAGEPASRSGPPIWPCPSPATRSAPTRGTATRATSPSSSPR